ncbi:MAG: DUF4105 domain-containing protein [Winogradskyella sp.]|uniref:lipoprotein N-acyltransferase Lnb domain-containing protein n=1 Tax=Winogradskyella sp. TaxID=1883156 RepID=UPI0017A774EA|nr:DUF4105 domain-containing protein [Winogradskyella sp.]MBT8243758.1 DUF4105 domain-containing protein [Winogradskyella sp.]NNK22049.1 DUF4105 domain-containing protein [Winogradskyella sp.]
MKLKLSLLITFFLFYISPSQELQLSPQAEVSVLTFSPSTNLNDAFGHNAFRIKDRNLGLDVVYGYGGYDFEAPNFILKFAQGKLNYLITKKNFSETLQTYSYYDRTIEQQKLNLNSAQKQKLYNYLINNYKPKNRRYLYDFFYDNCATKIRDVTNIIVNQSISYTTTSNEETTFRNLIHEQVGRNTWGSLGIDIALGSLIDRTITIEEKMFLPKYIYKNFETAKINNTQPLVSSTNTIYKSRENKSYTSNVFITSPIVIIGLLSAMILSITYRDYKSHKRTKWLDFIIFGVTGITGVLLLFLWFGTNHIATGYNYNLLWAFPLNLLALVQVYKNSVKNWFRSYLKFTVIMLCLMTMHWIIGVQIFAFALLPLLVALLTRYIYIISFFKKQQVL